MAKQVIPSIHIPIQEKDGSISWVWYMFLKYLSSIEGGSGASSLSQLSDVNISSPINNQYLVYDNGIWKNQTLSISWGQIGGDIEDQVDLKNALDSKQNVLTAGTNITIDENNVISATGGSELPDQTGNAGKFLVTNGTNASWGTTLTETLYLTGNNTQEKIIFNWGNNSSNNIICRATDYSLLFGYRNGGTFRQEFVFDWLYKSFHPINWQSSAIVTLGTSDYKWSNVYTKKINNGADIEVPNQAGTMVVANPTGATQGQVLTLDSNLTPAWADASSGSSYHPDLFDWKWADHICNNVQWLRADTFSWQAGSVYESAYQHLADDFTNGTRTLVPEGAGIWCYIAPDGHRIVDASDTTQVQNVIDLYNATGVAWYYIIDTTNERFKLPRAKPLNGAIVGNGMTLGLTDGTNTAGINSYANSTGLDPWTGLYGTSIGTAQSGSRINSNKSMGITTDSTKSGIIAERDNTDQHKYLYFYVGEFTQTAIENTAGITTEAMNNKVDKGFDIVEFQEPTVDNNYTWYKKYRNGWVEQGGHNHAIQADNTDHRNYINLPVTMANTNYTSSVVLFGNHDVSIGIIPQGSLATTRLCIGGYYTATSDTRYTAVDWQVSGMAA